MSSYAKECFFSLLELYWKCPPVTQAGYIAGPGRDAAAAAAAKSLKSRPTLCHPIDSNLPGSPVPGILQARTLEWVAISLSNA